MNADSDSDDEILPEARIIDICSENIWKEKSKAIEEYYKSLRECPNDPSQIDDDEVNDFLYPSRKSKKPKQSKDNTKKKTEVVTIKKTRGSKRKKKAEEYCEVESDQKSNATKPNSKVKLSAAARKKIRNVELEMNREKKRLDMELKEILDSPSEPTEVVVTETKKLDVIFRVQYLNNTSKIRAEPDETFSSLRNKIADIFNIKVTDFILCHNDKTLQLTETPSNLNLKLTDVIDCVPYSPLPHSEKDPNKILIKIQSNESRKKVELYINKFEPLSECMNRYAESHRLSLDQLHFKFDGEVLSGREIPEDLEMEDGTCLDVFHKTDGVSHTHNVSKNINISHNDDEEEDDLTITQEVEKR